MATLTRPPVFALASRDGALVTLASDTGAVARVFVLEEDVVRLWLLPDGTSRSLPSWAIAPGAEDIAEPGRDRLSVDGFTCPPFALAEADGVLTLATAQIRLAIRLAGFHCRWDQRVGDDWALYKKVSGHWVRRGTAYGGRGATAVAALRLLLWR